MAREDVTPIGSAEAKLQLAMFGRFLAGATAVGTTAILLGERSRTVKAATGIVAALTFASAEHQVRIRMRERAIVAQRPHRW